MEQEKMAFFQSPQVPWQINIVCRRKLLMYNAFSIINDKTLVLCFVLF